MLTKSLFDGMKNPGIDSKNEYVPVGDLQIAVIRYDAHGRPRYMNRAATAMMTVLSGGSRGLLTEAQLFSPPTLKRYLDAIAEVAATAVARELDLVFDGLPLEQRAHYQVYLAADRAGDGDPGVLAICFNITARNQAKAKLRERESFLESLLDAIPIPVFSKDVDGRYVHINQAFLDFLGIEREQFVGKTVFEVNPPELAATYFAKDAELLANGGVQRYDYKARNAQNEYRGRIY
jgi:PAS domain S-box-containing protein